MTPASVMKRFKANGSSLMSDFHRASLKMAWQPLCRITNESTEIENCYSSLNRELRWLWNSVYMQKSRFSYLTWLIIKRGARWPGGGASDSEARGRGFDTYIHRVVSLSKDTFTPRKVLVIPRKQWLRPDMTEKLLTATLSLATLSLNKTKPYNKDDSPIKGFWTP